MPSARPANVLCSFPPLLPPWRDCSPLLHPTHWSYSRLLGSDHIELDGSRPDVLVLLPECAWNQDLVEGVDHPSSDPPIRHRYWYAQLFTHSSIDFQLMRRCRLHLLRIIHILHLHLLPMDAQRRQLCRRRICCFCWHHRDHILPRPLHLLLYRDLQKGR